ncbi:hypothetical protein COU87_00555 [Candidatus Roizmanbacteria bacterium CG10_big_fil_rev_8_21_14_0_10_39_12]|uniref:Uncharacterized protein n=1 Tax=Candidatus Roizmanbacteria bacterium CG10_big_fil_rev_8_21_14_0_10_39_12 TaxID=1974852 RepID=A0A2M8KQM2_9BACT|nr:MAG: hypothetical protein COU87_00555 [Candidatus Roizmanbacteria bacterium CG10_big_fil_rev_8_21_14_0_10_39_12]
MDETSSLPIKPEITENPLTPPHKNKKLMILLIAIGLFVVFGSIGGGLWAFIQGQKDMQTIVQSQKSEFAEVQNTYDDVRNILDSIPTSPPSGNTDLLDNSKSKSIPSQYDDVLGVEEELGIDQNRKLSEEYKKGIKHLEVIKKNNRKIEALSQSNPTVSIFIPQNADLIRETDRFVDTSSALLTYLQKVNTFEINSTMVGYQVGLAIQEAVVRAGDDDSVTNLEKKIQEIDTLYDEFKSINIDAIPENLQIDHTEKLVTFDEDVEIFNQILIAFQEKNVKLLEKTLQSIIIQGQGTTNDSKVKFKTFWYENELINTITNLSDRWNEYGRLIGLSE